MGAVNARFRSSPLHRFQLGRGWFRGCQKFDPVAPGRVLSAFKRAAPALGLSRRFVDLIDHLMGYTREADWRGEWAPVVWPSNAQLQDVLGLGLSRVKELIREALDVGVIVARDHGTGKRFGLRGEGGRIVTACGFDLSPLGERVSEFEAVAAGHEARKAEAKRLRAETGRTLQLQITFLSLKRLQAQAHARPLKKAAARTRPPGQ